jgi:transposase-like protein
MAEVLLPEVADADDQDGRTVARKGIGRGRVEILGRERSRNWTAEQKQAIVAERLGSELTPALVARKCAISNGLLYAWRQQVLGGHVSIAAGATLNFAQVELAAAPQTPDGGAPSAAAVAGAPPAPLSWPNGLIEIVLPTGVLVRVDAR